MRERYELALKIACTVLAAVLLVFATGTTVSTVLAVLAQRRSDEAAEAREKMQAVLGASGGDV